MNDAPLSVERLLLARIGAETFAFPIAEVLEVTEAPEVTPLALLPAGVAGQSVHRDRLVPVLDAGALLGVPRTAPHGGSHGGSHGVLIVIAVEGEPVALWADDVVDMVTVEADRLRAVPAGSGAAGAMLRGVVDLGTAIAALVSMDDVRATVRARLMTEVA